jgi:hypothetical protein
MKEEMTKYTPCGCRMCTSKFQLSEPKETMVVITDDELAKSTKVNVGDLTG